MTADERKRVEEIRETGEAYAIYSDVRGLLSGHISFLLSLIAKKDEEIAFIKVAIDRYKALKNTKEVLDEKDYCGNYDIDNIRNNEFRKGVIFGINNTGMCLEKDLAAWRERGKGDTNRQHSNHRE